MQNRSDRRQADRIQLPAPYTAVAVQPMVAEPDHAAELEGHLYDLSQSGVRLELDEELPIGTVVALRLILPGRQPVAIRAVGEVVRCHEDEDAGPIRMGVHFDRFMTKVDQKKLLDYLSDHGCRINLSAA